VTGNKCKQKSNHRYVCEEINSKKLRPKMKKMWLKLNSVFLKINK
jgi:hypothetical protein